MKHTKGEWKAFQNISSETKQPIKGWHINGPDWVSMVQVSERYSNIADDPNTKAEAKANALHIVKCVNMHDELIDAIKEFYEYIGVAKTNSDSHLRYKLEQLIKKSDNH